MQDSPFVTIIMPIRNEVEFIERAVRSLLNNNYPTDGMEILVVDGISDDGTRDIIKHLAAEDSRVRLLDNPHRIVPHAMNKGINESRGDIIIRVDGHAAVAPDFVSQSVQVLKEHPDVWCAGGVMETVGTTYWGRVIAAAMGSPFGVGTGNFRLGNVEGYVDAVIFGAHWRWVFGKVGMFDEELVRNQDDEFIQRMVEAGAKQYMSPKIRSTYFSRSNWRKLMHQYFQYGFWRIRTIQKRKKPARLRQLIPLIFVLGWIILVLGACLWWPLLWPLACYAGLYLMLLTMGMVHAGRKASYKEALLVPFIFVIMHFAYGLGSLVGIWSWVILRGKYVPHGVAHKLSR
ncbi:MAG: glycosyltransferase family 2 protein [Planctomycetota bacterium]|jgi:glycosyltransferase involved in cell wall biosynthesis